MFIETHNIYIHKYLKVFLGKEGYDNNCSRIIYEQKELENIELLSCCERSEPNFFGGKLALEPLNLLYPFKLSVKNTQNKKSRTTN